MILDADTLGAGEAGFTMDRIQEGLLVVRNMPAAAFLVTREGAKPLPDLFNGLRSPVAEWAPLDFSVHGVRGSLVDMAFTMDASASGEVREVRGRPGRWKVTKPKRPAWIAPEVVAPPIKTKKGGELFERAADYQSEARRGFRFEWFGAPSGERSAGSGSASRSAARTIHAGRRGSMAPSGARGTSAAGMCICAASPASGGCRTAPRRQRASGSRGALSYGRSICSGARSISSSSKRAGACSSGGADAPSASPG